MHQLIATLLLSASLAASAHADPQPNGNLDQALTGFYGQLRHAQLRHVTPAHHGDSAGRRQSQQPFGKEGGVLQAIWQSQFQGYANQSTLPASASPELSQNFIADIRRIHFSHLEG